MHRAQNWQGFAPCRAAGPTMITDLFAVTSGLDAGVVLDAIPPTCRRTVDSAPAAMRDARTLVVEFPAWRPRRPSTHFLPALAVLGTARYSVRFELSVEQRGRWSAWAPSTSLGPGEFEAPCTSASPLRCEVDVFLASEPVDRARLRLRVLASDVDVLASARWLATLSACDAEPRSATSNGSHRSRAATAVPALSQMEEAETIRLRICSPTSVAMVLGRWGIDVEPSVLAAEAFHPGLDRYGVWPAAIRAAAAHGVLGYLLRFPDWDTAAWCLTAGLPIVASVRYARGELSGAAIEETTGHLIVLTGFDGSDVLVHDPAAPTRGDVPRRYARAELERVWLDRSGVGYVFFPPSGVPKGG